MSDNQSHQEHAKGVVATPCQMCDDSGVWPILPRHYCGCQAGVEREADDHERAIEQRRSQAWAATGIPPRFEAFDLEAHPDRQAVEQVASWRPDATGTNLLISGIVGSGKTGLIVGLARELIASDITGIAFWSTPELLDRMRPPANFDPMRAVQRTRILILDDLGVEKPSDWVRERMYVLLNARYEAILPTIVTSNADLARLAGSLGERTISRFSEHLRVVTITGRDRRAGT
ncbi:MAG: ATP-binding protein [Chloroflexota bacterium]|nr:ATP-binding protein [Chloroflexota bacterium]